MSSQAWDVIRIRKTVYRVLFISLVIFLLMENKGYAEGSYENDGVYQFVCRLYSVILERDPDPTGLDGWYHQLITQNESGAEVVRGFLFSDEFINRGRSNEDYLGILYRTLFDRDPDPVGYEQWLAQLNAGVSRLTICKGFVDSIEFQNLCDTYGIVKGTIESSENGQQIYLVDQFVRRLYVTALGRDADPDGLRAWKDVLIQGNSTGAEIVQGFIFSVECNNKNLSDDAYIELLYQALFDRSADETGKQNWLRLLQHGLTRQYVCCGFINSVEFNDLCARYGIPKGSASSEHIRDRNEALTIWISELYIQSLERSCSVGELENALYVFFSGMSTGNSFVSSILLSEEYKAKNTSNEAFLEVIYKVVLDQNTDGGDYTQYLNQLASGAERGEVLTQCLKTNTFMNRCAALGIPCDDISLNIPDQSDGELVLFNTSRQLSDTSWNGLQSVIDEFYSRNHEVGFVAIDLNTGQGFGYNINKNFYCASTIKGPYVVCLNEKVPTSVAQWGSVMRSTIMISSNEGYTSLRMAFGSTYFGEWLKEAGCSQINPVLHYPDLNPKALAQMWTKCYAFFISDKPNAQWCSELFTNTIQSPILKTLGGTYTTYSKAGWIGEGGYLNVHNDAGIVMKPGHPYVLAIMSSAYGRTDLLGELVSAIDMAHTELVN